jgi:hypothetical protein
LDDKKDRETQGQEMTARLANTVRRFSHCFTVIRQEPGEYVQGRYKKTAARRFEARGSIQPAAPEEIALLPEGVRADGAVTIWTECELLIGSSRERLPDHVLFQGTEYEVRAEADWLHHGAFRRYVAGKAGQ